MPVTCVLITSHKKATKHMPPKPCLIWFPKSRLLLQSAMLSTFEPSASADFVASGSTVTVFKGTVKSSELHENYSGVNEKFWDVALIFRARIFLRFRNICHKIATYGWKRDRTRQLLVIHPIKFRIWNGFLKDLILQL